jgi:hypothetical protein
MFLKTVQNIVLFDVDELDAVRLLLQHKHYSTQLSALAFVRVGIQKPSTWSFEWLERTRLSRSQNKEYRIQKTAAAKLMYIKLPMILYFISHLD